MYLRWNKVARTFYYIELSILLLNSLFPSAPYPFGLPFRVCCFMTVNICFYVDFIANFIVMSLTLCVSELIIVPMVKPEKVGDSEHYFATLLILFGSVFSLIVTVILLQMRMKNKRKVRM